MMLSEKAKEILKNTLTVIKQRSSEKVLKDSSRLYYYFVDFCPRQDLKILKTELNIEEIFSSGLLSNLAISQVADKIDGSIVSDTILNFVEKKLCDEKTASQLCVLFLSVINPSLKVEESSKELKNLKARQLVNKLENKKTLQENFVQIKEEALGFAFEISDHLLTQAEYFKVTGKNPSHFKGDNLPVERVSFFDAVEYCNKRSKLEGILPYYEIIEKKVKIRKGSKGYRLLGQAEWVYAASGGNKAQGFSYPGGEELYKLAWFNLNSDLKTHPIKLKEPNEIGLFDMAGNVWQWVFDVELFAKGGSWASGREMCKISFSKSFAPESRYSDLGFRIARSL